MPIQSLFWPDNTDQDIHLVPGFVGPRLDQQLWIEDTGAGGNQRADSPPAGVTVTFAPNFTAGPLTAGVTVSARGEVTVTSALPAGARLLDFLVVATATEGATTKRAWRRFRIHRGITRIWLTPSPLTVRRSTRRCRFSLLAEFDDGVVGDITPWCPWDVPPSGELPFVHENGQTVPAVSWHSAASGTVAVDGQTAELTGAAAAGTATISASIGPLPPVASRTTSATARAAPAWNTPATLTHLSGPGFGAMGTSPNVLLLPDGFAAADRGAFERLARDCINKLTHRQRTRPFDLVRDRMNYFLAWVESPQAGFTALAEIQRVNVSGTTAEAEDQPPGIEESAVAAEWHTGTPPTPATNTRFVLNDRDTAFHIGRGSRPRAHGGDTEDDRSAGFNPLRFHEDDFDDFLRALRDTGGTAVGATWAQGGRDQKSVVLFARSRRLAGSNNGRANGVAKVICMTYDELTSHRIQDNAAGGKDPLPDTIPSAAPVDMWTTTAHELSHSLTLLDEYGGSGIFPASEEADVAACANLQSRTTLLTGANLDADRIKWRWPRIAKSGVLAAAPLAVGGGRHRVRLQPGHASSFAVGDVVRFRTRPLLVAGAPSPRFIVMTMAGDELEVEPVAAAPFTPATFVAGSVLISPVRAPDPNPATRTFGDDLELVHARVRAHINATRNPLNTAAGAPANRPCSPTPALPTPTRARNFPPGPRTPPRYSAWLVGLFENGDAYDCGVYRPTGICLMRDLHYRDPPSSPSAAYQFCHVCRYAIVDLLEPSKHGIIDADYAARYPA